MHIVNRVISGMAAAMLAGTVTATIGPADASKPQTLTVTKGSHDGSRGTLRWAISLSNDLGGAHIQITKAAGIIKLTSPPPAVGGHTTIEGVSGRHGPRVGIDGGAFVDVTKPLTSNSSPNDSPSVVPNSAGAYTYGPNVRSISNSILRIVDDSDVEISGLELLNSCIGVLGLRSHDLYIHDNVVRNMVGAAGIILTGDAEDQAGSSTDTSFGNVVANNTIINRGDAAEFTRGTRGSVFRNNTFAILPDAPAGVLASQAVEFASAGDANTMIGNKVLSGFSDGF